MESIGLYMPGWLYRSDVSDRRFFRELAATIKDSGRYVPSILNLEKPLFSSQEEADIFCAEKNLIAVVQHDSVYYSKNANYRANISFLEKRVRFLNSMEAHAVGHNKALTKQTLRQRGIPVLADQSVLSVEALGRYTKDGALYVIKPTNEGAGAGVQLIRKDGAGFSGYRNGKWRAIDIQEEAQGLVVRHAPRFHPVFSFLERPFIYNPMLVEPFFNDSEHEFSSLRCTVVGDMVVESVRRVNRKNVTSNISRGGTAEAIELSEYQKEIAVAASRAVGADYAGVDLLASGGKSVVCEVNIGPFTLYSKYTGVPVGTLFGEYVIAQCDAKRLRGY